MKKNMFKTRRWASVLQVLFLAAMVCVFIFLVIYFAGTVFKGYKIVSQDTVYLDTFVYLDADYAFEPVAHDEEGMQYAFVLTEHDEEYYKYLIRLSEKDYEESGLKTLVSESEECVNDEKPASAPLHLTGYVVHAG